MIQHAEAINRSIQVINLDPAAEHFNYPVMAGKSNQESGRVGIGPRVANVLSLLFYL